MSAESLDLLDYAAAAKRLGVSVKAARRLVYRKRLVAVRIGYRTVRFRPADIDRCIARRAGEGGREW